MEASCASPKNTTSLISLRNSTIFAILFPAQQLILHSAYLFGVSNPTKPIAVDFARRTAHNPPLISPSAILRIGLKDIAVIPAVEPVGKGRMTFTSDVTVFSKTIKEESGEGMMIVDGRFGAKAMLLGID